MLFSCSDDNEGLKESMSNEQDVPVFVRAFSNLNFNQPLFITHPGDGSNQLYLLEKTGRILSFENSQSIGEFSIYLDISDRIINSGEQGLLGFAFHPNYTANRRVFVNYSGSAGQTVISEFSADVADNSADPNSETMLLEIDQPFANHNGGMIAFGPDNYLYIGTGDGGSGGDPQNNAQNRNNLLGKILRIDIDGSGDNYDIPSDNPFAGNTEGFREEIYAYGLRNPWRFSFDAQTDDLWLADVGQNQTEEVNIIVSGGNYGWNIMEGSNCFESSSCDQNDLQLPITEYDHDLGNSITGGYVYRGSKFPELVGHYFYGDFGSGRIWALDVNNLDSDPELFSNTDFNISSFGVDENNEIYLLNFATGSVHQLEKQE